MNFSKSHLIFISLLIIDFPIFSIELSRNPRWSLSQSEIARVSRTAISPNQEIVALGGKMGFQESSPVIIQIRSLDSGKLLHTIDGFGNSLVSLAGLKFSRDGKYLYAIYGNKISFWSTNNWNLSSNFLVEEEVLGIDLSSDNQWVAVSLVKGGEKNFLTQLLIYKRETGQLTKEILNISSKKMVVSHIIFSNNSSILYGAVENSRTGIIAWDLKSGKEVYYASQKGYGVNFGINEKGNRLVTAEATNNKINLFELSTGKLVKSYTVPTSSLGSIGFHPNGEHIIIGRRVPKEFIQILNIKTESVSSFPGQMQVFRFDLSKDGSILSIAAFFNFQLPNNLSFAVYDMGSHKEISQLASSYGAEDFKLGHEVEVNISGDWIRGFVGQIAPKSDQVLVEFPDKNPLEKTWAEAADLRFIKTEDRRIDPMAGWKTGARVLAKISGKEYSGVIGQIKKDTGWILIRFDSDKPKSSDWIRPWNLKLE